MEERVFILTRVPPWRWTFLPAKHTINVRKKDLACLGSLPEWVVSQKKFPSKLTYPMVGCPSNGLPPWCEEEGEENMIWAQRRSWRGAVGIEPTPAFSRPANGFAARGGPSPVPPIGPGNIQPKNNIIIYINIFNIFPRPIRNFLRSTRGPSLTRSKAIFFTASEFHAQGKGVTFFDPVCGSASVSRHAEHGT